MSPRPLLLVLAATAAMTAAASAFALSTDKDQPVLVDADAMELDFKTGKRTYIGSVVAKQGTLVIRGDRCVMTYKDDKLQKATCRGQPATFKQRPDGQVEDVRGRAPKLILNEVTHTLFMHEGSTLIKGADTIRGKDIRYDINTSRMIVKGGAPAAATGGTTGRTHIRLAPKNKSGAAGKPASKPARESEEEPDPRPTKELAEE